MWNSGLATISAFTNDPSRNPIFPIHQGTSSSSSSSISAHNNRPSSRRSTKRFQVSCTSNNNEESQSQRNSGGGGGGGVVPDSWSSPYQALGLDPSSPCSPSDLKAAFRARVKEFHPDVCKDVRNSDAIIRRVIRAYEVLSKYHQSDTSRREHIDPFEEPECEAVDLFVNETLCIGKGCPYSCVERAPHAFSFALEIGTARAISQGHGEDYQVQLAVGQCPRSCIYFVTPSQRAVLEELLYSVLDNPYDSAEAAMLESLIAKARLENNRYQKKPPKKPPKFSSEFVDWF
ncbi:hypothetical protein QJS10_CPB04g00699 [Acorus calamus]|uniref:J domain-containing protein n=1 Tax=Acorus calamus TaxID=4465 RepID=A0AAV9F1Z0_ACOCL|nr:hypothetical protein QJS10_CPB04g00699 [Acorus calamus]